MNNISFCDAYYCCDGPHLGRGDEEGSFFFGLIFTFLVPPPFLLLFLHSQSQLELFVMDGRSVVQSDKSKPLPPRPSREFSAGKLDHRGFLRVRLARLSNARRECGEGGRPMTEQRPIIDIFAASAVAAISIGFGHSGLGSSREIPCGKRNENTF